MVVWIIRVNKLTGLIKSKIPFQGKFCIENNLIKDTNLSNNYGGDRNDLDRVSFISGDQKTLVQKGKELAICDLVKKRVPEDKSHFH